MDRVERCIVRCSIAWSSFWLGWAVVFGALRITEGRWGWAVFEVACGTGHVFWLRFWLRQLARANQPQDSVR